jgi:hypothetical protein
MNEQQLKRHIDKFASRGEYLLEVECDHTYAGIRLSNRSLAFMLCETAQKTGLTKYIRLFRHPKVEVEVDFPNDEMEEVVFESSRLN